MPTASTTFHTASVLGSLLHKHSWIFDRSFTLRKWALALLRFTPLNMTFGSQILDDDLKLMGCLIWPSVHEDPISNGDTVDLMQFLTAYWPGPSEALAPQCSMLWGSKLVSEPPITIRSKGWDLEEVALLPTSDCDVELQWHTSIIRVLLALIVLVCLLSRKTTPEAFGSPASSVQIKVRHEVNTRLKCDWCVGIVPINVSVIILRIDADLAFPNC